MHDPRLPFFDLDKPRDVCNGDFAEETYQMTKMAHEAVRINLEDAKEVQERYYNHREKTKTRTFLSQDKVMVYFPNPPPGINPKFFSHWKRYTVVEMVGKVNALVRSLETGKTSVIHLDRIKALNESIDDTSEEEQDHDMYEAPPEEPEVNGNPEDGARGNSQPQADQVDSQNEEEQVPMVETLPPAHTLDTQASRSQERLRQQDSPEHELDQQPEEFQTMEELEMQSEPPKKGGRTRTHKKIKGKARIQAPANERRQTRSMSKAKEIAYLDNHEGKPELLQQQFWARKKKRDEREIEDDSYFYFPAQQNEQAGNMNDSHLSYESAHSQAEAGWDSSGDAQLFQTADPGTL